MRLTSDVVHNPPGALERAKPPARDFALDEEDSARFLRVVSQSLSISRHYQLFVWLSGELQQFLPHQILVSAWGDFAQGKISVDLVSGLPGVRTAALARCRIDAIVGDAYRQWIDAKRRPLVLNTSEIAMPRPDCPCHIHDAIRNMRSLLVHGIRDERTGHESLYIALHSGLLNRGRATERFLSLVDSLVAHIDYACRRITALPLEGALEPLAGGFALSEREHQILELLCRGQRNDDIAQTLAISPYTVKNHVQRIFRKVGASNRTQAAAKYNGMRSVERRLDD